MILATVGNVYPKNVPKKGFYMKFWVKNASLRGYRKGKAAQKKSHHYQRLKCKRRKANLIAFLLCLSIYTIITLLILAIFKYSKVGEDDTGPIDILANPQQQMS